MNVQMAKVAGFCMGVRRAMEMALKAAREAAPPVYTYGPLIHNPSALFVLKAKGVEVLDGIPPVGRGTVIVRAHGIPPEDKAGLVQAGYEIVDATCPRVIKVQMLARHFARKGATVILFGDRGHPEVMGIMGHAGDKGVLVSDEADLEELLSLGQMEDYVILAQTTQDRERFERWSGCITARFPGGRVFNTICDSTHKRQGEVRRLASRMDAVVVVGGKESANTRRLAEIVEECGKTAIPVETEEDIDREFISRFKEVGVTAGASTPNWVINRVVQDLQAIAGVHEPGWYRVLRRFVRFLHQANLITAMAGGCLAWVGISLLKSMDPDVVSSPASAVVEALCYIYAMHTLNRLIDWEAGEFNDPLRAKYMAGHRRWFVLASVAAMGASLALAWQAGLPSFLMLVLLSAFGVLYTIPMLPGLRSSKSLKELPGSKTLFVALAWSAVCVIIPAGVWPTDLGASQWILFFLVGGLVYIRTALLEVFDLQGDKIVGKETLAVLIGEKKAVRLVKVLAVALAASSLVLGASGLMTPHCMLLAIPACYMVWLSRRALQSRIGQDMHLEPLVESSFFLLFLAQEILLVVTQGA